MTNIIICYIIVFIILIFTLRFVFLMLSPAFTKFKTAPYVPSFDNDLSVIKSNLQLPPSQKILDLGCGDGKALRFFFKNFGLQGTGYDINPFAIFYGKILNRYYKTPDIKLIKSDFQKANLSEYDYIYTYLFPSQMAMIEDRIFQNIKKDTIIISNSFKFKKNQPYQIIQNKKNKDTIFLYKKS